MGVVCFMLEPTGMVRLYLRRWEKSCTEKCPAQQWGTHHGITMLRDVARADLVGADKQFLVGHSYNSCSIPGWLFETFSKDDPRWPTTCECGYKFKDNYTWQNSYRDLWRRSDKPPTFPLITEQAAPPGAMWYKQFINDWPSQFEGKEHREQRRGQPHLMVKCPGGRTWDIDSMPSNQKYPDGGWTRTGTPPRVTARASIDTGNYHGYLTDGVFNAC